LPLYQGRNLFAKYFSSQFIHVQDSPVFDMDYVSDSVFEEILTSVLEEHFPEIESLTEHQKKALLAVINGKDVLFALLLTGHGNSIIFQLLPDVCKYLYLSGYSYPHHATILVLCPLSLPWTLISMNCETVAFQCSVWAAKTRSLCLSIRKSRVLLTKRVSAETCSVVMFNKTEPSRLLRMKRLILTNTRIDPGQVGQVIPLSTTQVETISD